MLVQEIQVTVFIIVPVAYAIYRGLSHDVISAMLVSKTSPLWVKTLSLYRGQSLPSCDLYFLLPFFCYMWSVPGYQKYPWYWGKGTTITYRFFTIYTDKPVSLRFRQMIRKIQSRLPFVQISFIYRKTTENAWNCYQRCLSRNGITVSDVPVLSEKFGWNDQKSHVPLLSYWTFRELVEMVNNHHNMEILEMPVEKSNGSRHFVWESSENMGCKLRRCNFSTLFSPFSRCGFTLQRAVLSARQISEIYVYAQDWFPPLWFV